MAAACRAGSICPGSSRSPDMLAPAMMPVTAGKNSANMVKKLVARQVAGAAVGGEVRRAWRRGSRRRRTRPARAGQDGEDAVLHLDRPAGADVDADEDDEVDEPEATCGRRAPRPGKTSSERLGEADHVHRDRDRLGEEEDDADGAAELDAEAAADQEVGAAALDARIGGDGRDREGGQGGDQLGAER